MSPKNVELVQRGLEDYMATGEIPRELFDEGIEIHDHDTPDQGAYVGHAGLGRWLDDWGAAWSEWSIEPEEYIDAGDSVVVFIRMRTKGRGSGVEMERQDALVYRLQNGRIVRADYYNNRAEALRGVDLGS
jgi:ketosteroid isomerase-like protein